MEQSGFKGFSVQCHRAGATGAHVVAGILCAVFLSIAGAALSNPVFAAGVLDADPVVPGELEQPINAVPYADAMADCAGRILATLVVGCDLIPAELEERHSFWIWRSDAGATVNRTLKGDYRIRSRSCLGGFCSWLSCRVSEWPTLSCDDGGRLKAQVPDQSRFTIDGTDYVRVRALQ